MLSKVLAILMACAVVAQAAQKRYDGDKVFRLIPQNEQQLSFLRNFLDAPGEKFDFWAEPSFVGSNVDIRIAADTVAMFAGLANSTKIPNKVMIDDVQKLIDDTNAINAQRAKSRAGGSIVGTFPTFDDTMNWLESLCISQSDLASCGTVGTSYEGRNFKWIKLGNPSGSPKQKIWVEGTMHAREWLGTATVTYIIDRLLTTYNTDATAKRMLDDYDWIFIPISNPDGYEHSRTSDRLWRKTRSKVSNTCYGADPNRNFAFNWGAPGASASPCSDTFRGSAAFSEPETKALSDFITKNKTDTRVYFSIHTYSQLWLIPYGNKPLPADFTELKRVATIGADALMAVNKKTWKVGNIVDLLYEASGGSIDWAKGDAGIKYTYCLELRPGERALNGFVVDTSEIDPSGREVWAGLVAAIDAIP